MTADPRAAKWADLIAPGTPLSTPWPRDLFTARTNDFQERRRRIRAENRREAEMDALFLQQEEEPERRRRRAAERTRAAPTSRGPAPRFIPRGRPQDGREVACFASGGPRA